MSYNRIAPPRHGWTLVRPLPHSEKKYNASWLTNPPKDMAQALLEYQATGVGQSFILDAEGDEVEVTYSYGNATVTDIEGNVVESEKLDNKDIDHMLIEIAQDVAAYSDKWLYEWDSECDEELESLYRDQGLA